MASNFIVALVGVVAVASAAVKVPGQGVMSATFVVVVASSQAGFFRSVKLYLRVRFVPLTFTFVSGFLVSVLSLPRFITMQSFAMMWLRVTVMSLVLGSVDVVSCNRWSQLSNFVSSLWSPAMVTSAEVVGSRVVASRKSNVAAVTSTLLSSPAQYMGRAVVPSVGSKDFHVLLTLFILA